MSASSFFSIAAAAVSNIWIRERESAAGAPERPRESEKERGRAEAAAAETINNICKQNNTFSFIYSKCAYHNYTQENNVTRRANNISKQQRSNYNSKQTLVGDQLESGDNNSSSSSRLMCERESRAEEKDIENARTQKRSETTTTHTD